MRTSRQRGGPAPTRSFLSFSPGPPRPSRRTRRSQRARRCSRWRSPPAAVERSPGAGSPVEVGPPGSHRGRIGGTNNKVEPVRARTDSLQLYLLCWLFRFSLSLLLKLLKLKLALIQTHHPLRCPTPEEWIRWCAARLLRGPSQSQPQHTRFVSVSRQYPDSQLTGSNLKSAPLRVTTRIGSLADNG